MLFLGYFILFSYCLASVQSCKSTESAASNSKQSGTERIDRPVTDSQIWFITIEIFSNDSIALIEERKVSGLLKQDYDQLPLLKGNHLLCELLDTTGQIIKSAVVANPLKQIYETPADESGLRTVEVQKEKGSFFLRTSYDPKVASLRIFMIESDLSNRVLGNIKIGDQ